MEKSTWWKEGIVYQVYPKSFYDSNGDGIGDIEGIIAKLDYLKELGITVIWLSPFFKSPGVDNGYDISDYEDVDEIFGTMKDITCLIEQAHARNIRIIIDLVMNHTSDRHPWFIESKKGNAPWSDYYIWRDAKDGHEPNRWGSVFSGSAWTYCPERGQYYLHLFAPQQPDLNWTDSRVRRELFAMMDRWCRRGIDGFRMDVIGCISKPDDLYTADSGSSQNGFSEWGSAIMNRNRVHEYLKEMNSKVLSRYDIMTVGETSCVTPQDAIQYAGFDSGELNMVFQFEHIEAEINGGSKWTDRKVSLVMLKRILSRWQQELDGKAWNSLFWENHDQPRCVSKYGDCTTYWKQSAKMLAVCMYMLKGTPYIYQGQELGMTNTRFASIDELDDIESKNAYKDMVEKGNLSSAQAMALINAAGRDNARTPFQWSDGAYAGFSTARPWLPVNGNYTRINVEAEEQDEDSVLRFYRKLIAFRKSSRTVMYGSYSLLYPEDEKLFVYTRSLEQETLLVICNFSADTCTLAIPENFTGAACVLSNYSRKTLTDGRILPFEAGVYRMQG